jgi:hypothetical protein
MKEIAVHSRWKGFAGCRRGLVLVLLLLVLLGLVATALAASGTTLNWQVIAGGGAPVLGTRLHINATLGQPVIGISSGSQITLRSGYWPGIQSQFNIFMPMIVR